MSQKFDEIFWIDRFWDEIDVIILANPGPPGLAKFQVHLEQWLL